MLFLVVGGVAGAQIKEMKLSGCILKSSSSVNNVLNRMTQDPNIEHIVLDSEDPNYFPFKKELLKCSLCKKISNSKNK
jgi:hypothetical protein